MCIVEVINERKSNKIYKTRQTPNIKTDYNKILM